MKLQVLDKKGKNIEEITLKDSVFKAEINKDLLAQYIYIYTSNQRQGTSSTKDRSEVSGGGKKPWRQKGTGRARVGSIRSPLWRHGGVTHGPNPKSWNLKLSKRLKQQAMISALSAKVSSNTLKILDDLSIKTPKTKEISNLMKTLELKGKILFVLAKNDQAILKSSANIKNISISQASNLNVYELLRAKNVLFLKKAIEEVEKKYANK